MTETDCPFCGLKDRVLKENQHAAVVLSNPRKVPGHFLVLPKRHIEQPWDLTQEELNDVFNLVFQVEQRLIEHGLGTGADIRQNYRPFQKQAGLSASHVLFHVIPRSQDDYIYSVSERFEKDLFAELDELERKEVSKLLIEE